MQVLRLHHSPGRPEGVPGPWLWPGLVLAVGATWGANSRWGIYFFSLYLSIFQINKHIKNREKKKEKKHGSRK